MCVCVCVCVCVGDHEDMGGDSDSGVPHFSRGVREGGAEGGGALEGGDGDGDGGGCLCDMSVAESALVSPGW